MTMTNSQSFSRQRRKPLDPCLKTTQSPRYTRESYHLPAGRKRDIWLLPECAFPNTGVLAFTFTQKSAHVLCILVNVVRAEIFRVTYLENSLPLLIHDHQVVLLAHETAFVQAVILHGPITKGKPVLPKYSDFVCLPAGGHCSALNPS